jgi:O-methyltransferase
MTYPADLSVLADFPGWQAAREPRAAGPTAEAEDLRRAYLELLKLALCDLTGTSTTSVGKWPDGSLSSRELAGEDRRLRAAGMDWPLHGLSMVGLNRLDDLQSCVEAVVHDDVPGDLIEAGTWRGGASMLMRATLDSLGARDRTVWVADSFQGFPAADVQGHLSATDFLAVPEQEVRASFARLGLEAGVRFVPGFFEDTLPELTGRTWSLVRLDGDTYEATWLTLEALYPGLAVGGHVVVDDYDAMPECSRAVDAFREHHGIREPLERVDWTCVRWRRASDDAIQRTRPVPERAHRRTVEPVQRTPPGAVPTDRERELAAEVTALREQLAEARAELARVRRGWLGRRLAAGRRPR